MTSIADAKAYSLDRIAKTPVTHTPFAHMVVEDVFPPDFYAEMRKKLPAVSSYIRYADTGRVLKELYSPERLCFMQPTGSSLSETEAFWKALFKTYSHSDFVHLWFRIFGETIKNRILEEPSLYSGDGPLMTRSEIYLMRDQPKYVLNPHTDSASKIISVLYYLPADDSAPSLGTALYQPKERGLKDGGGPHLDRALFDLATTVPFRPNTMLAFPKTNTCFHGVEPVSDNQVRDLMLYNIRFEPKKKAA